MPVAPLDVPIRWRIRWIAVAASALLGCFAAPATAAASGLHDPALKRLAARHPAQRVEVIAQFRPSVTLDRARWLVRASHGRPGSVLAIIHAVTARMSARDAARLAHRAGVRAVSLNARVKAQAAPPPPPPPGPGNSFPDPKKLNPSFVQSSDTDPAWPHATGQGVGVAVVDSGIDGDLPDFATSQTDPTSRVIVNAVVNPDATTAGDPYGHGTHVAGIIAGNSLGRGNSDKDYGKYAGVAPNANLIAIKAGDDQGNASVIDIINGIQFAIDHEADYNIKVLNLSLESASAESYTTDPLDAAVEAAWFSGITVVAAAGNRGTASDAVSYAPGNDPYVISVGGFDDGGTKGDADDTIPDWSSRGTTQDGFAKPDVYAPGAHIVSLLAPDSAFASLCPSCMIDGAYIKVSGTSMAAPVVAGAAADILQMHPDWTPDMVKGAIVNTAHQAKRLGIGELDTNKALGAGKDKLVSNQGLTPNSAIVDPGTGTVDLTRSRWSRSSWSRSSWSSADGDLTASWARSSWSCACDTSGS